MSPAHCDKNPSDFQGRGTAFIATKPRPTSRVALRQKTVRLPGIRQLDIATSRPTSRASIWKHRKNGHFLNCGEQINGVLLVASHGVQGLERWEDDGHVAMLAVTLPIIIIGTNPVTQATGKRHRKGSSRHASPHHIELPPATIPPYETPGVCSGDRLTPSKSPWERDEPHHQLSRWSALRTDRAYGRWT
jgi:hypothetical protein